VLLCAAEVALIGYDARTTSSELTNQMIGVSNRAILLSGQHSAVRHSAGVVFGFIVGFSSSTPPSLTSVLLQLWRPRHADRYQLVCQREVFLPANTSHQVAESNVTGVPYSYSREISR